MNFHGFDANQAVIAYWGSHSTELPEFVRNRVAEKIAKGGLQQLDGALEGLYSARTNIGEAGLELLGGLADFFARNGFMGKGLRAGQIHGVAARIIANGPAEDEGDPEVDLEFVEETQTPVVLPEG